MSERQDDLPGIPSASEGRNPAEPDVATVSPRLKTVDRTQLLLRSVVVEQLIPEDHPARAIWEFVGRLDLTPYTEQVRSIDGAAGRPAFDPQLLVSLWIYSYSRGISSAREIERLCEYDPAYQWLTGMERLSAHTLSDFRVDHTGALRAVKREVWRRDGGRCAFWGERGRCRETGFLEFHHVVPYAEGGATTCENLEISLQGSSLVGAALRTR